jgi:hypothetical protein
MVRVKHKVIFALLAVGILLFAWMQMVYLPGQEKLEEEEKVKQLNPETHNFEQVLQYENQYMGNASNDANLIGSLPPLSDVPWTYELKSEEFKLIVNYNEPLKEIGEEKVEKTILYNATAAFSLIKNLEIVEFAFPDRSYTVTRGRVNEWFGENVSTFNDGKIFAEKVQQPIVKKEQLAEWFDAYIGGGVK